MEFKKVYGFFLILCFFYAPWHHKCKNKNVYLVYMHTPDALVQSAEFSH